MLPIEELLRIAEETGVSVNKVKEGEIPCIRIDGRSIYDIKEEMRTIMEKGEYVMNTKDIRIDLISIKPYFPRPSCNQQRLVQIKHIPSGIIVTKYHVSQTKAKKDCMVELEELVRLWEGN